MKNFFASAGLTDRYSQQPPSKLRRTSSEIQPITVPESIASQSLSRTLSDLQNVSNIYSNHIRSSQQQLKNDDKENSIPESNNDENQDILIKPVARPVQRTPLGQLTPNLNFWSIDQFNLNQQILKSNIYTMNSILGKKTPVKHITMPTQKMTNSPKAFRPVVSTISNQDALAAMYLTSICNG